MPRTRVTLPVQVDIDITPEAADTIKAGVDVAKRVRDSGLVDAVSQLVGAAKRMRRTRRPSR